MGLAVRAIDLRNLVPATTPAMMKALGLTFLRLAQQRMDKGIGTNGGPMVYPGQPKLGVYSYRWGKIRRDGVVVKRQSTPPPGKKARTVTRRIGGGRVVDRRTLTFSGRMKAARGVKKVTKTSVLVGWAPGEEALKAAGNEARHKWIAPTVEEREYLVAQARDNIKRHVREQLARARAAKR